MTNKERLAYAEKRLDEATKKESLTDINYWLGVIAGLRWAMQKEAFREDLSDGALD